MKVLVDGCGSIGTRYCNILRELGHEVLCYDIKDDISMFRSLRDDIKIRRPDAVIVCTPTKLHIYHAIIAISSGCPVLIEKPLSHNIKDIKELNYMAENTDLYIGVVHNLRYIKGLQKIKNEYIKKIGKINYIYINCASYLPDWNPNRDYRKVYSADPESGGAILDCIHEIDYCLWLLGFPKINNVKCEKIYKLFDNPESGAVIEISTENCPEIVIYLSFDQKISTRYCRMRGEGGSILWDYYERISRCIKRTAVESERENFEYKFETNDMYRDMLKDFLDKSRGGHSSEFQHDIEVLKVALKARNDEALC